MAGEVQLIQQRAYESNKSTAADFEKTEQDLSAKYQAAKDQEAICKALLSKQEIVLNDAKYERNKGKNVTNYDSILGKYNSLKSAYMTASFTTDGLNSSLFSAILANGRIQSQLINSRYVS